MSEGLGNSLLVNNIILVGYMAAGKSSVGKLLSNELGWNFIDTDQVIEEVAGLKISEIFRKYGEVRFRSEEKLIIQKISKAHQTVISTGGGTILDRENWRVVQKSGLTIHLFVPLEIALERVKKRQERPLLMKSQEEIENLWQERLEIYNEAHISVDTSHKDIATITAEIVDLLKGGYIKQ